LASPPVERIEGIASSSPPGAAPSRPPLAPPRWGRHLLLFAVTAVSVFLAGGLTDTGIEPRAGLELAVALLAILVSHEMGHYVACRIYRVDATLPFFIPALWLPLGGLGFWAPIPFMGTFGAVIQIKERFPDRKALFDIGIAGPLAGFAVCLPVLYLGLRQAHPVPDDPSLGLTFAEPLAFRLAESLFTRPTPAGMTLAIGPLGLAAWFGLLVTALNLMPVGQLDGGHVLYALFRGHARRLSRLAWWACLALVLVSPSWIIWTVFLFFLGRDHPATVDDGTPLGGARVAVSLIGLGVLVLCFMPDPLPGAWSQLGDLPGAVRDLLLALFRR
jgi:membrane-associated protease RseP (regulator of RpoE activity)